MPTVVLTPLEYAACGLSEEKANVTFGEASIEVHTHTYTHTLTSIHTQTFTENQIVIPFFSRCITATTGPWSGSFLEGIKTPAMLKSSATSLTMYDFFFF